MCLARCRPDGVEFREPVVYRRPYGLASAGLECQGAHSFGDHSVDSPREGHPGEPQNLDDPLGSLAFEQEQEGVATLRLGLAPGVARGRANSLARVISGWLSSTRRVSRG